MTGKKILLDSNLTVLLAVGLTDKSYISKHKRLSAYDENDFDIVIALLSESKGIVFSPNVLSEVSNFLRQTKDPIKTEISNTFIKIISGASEIFVESRDASLDQHFLRLGLTDAVMLMLANTESVLFTADAGLYIAALERGHEAINYFHLKEQRPDFQT